MRNRRRSALAAATTRKLKAANLHSYRVVVMEEDVRWVVAGLRDCDAIADLFRAEGATVTSLSTPDEGVVRLVVELDL